MASGVGPKAILMPLEAAHLRASLGAFARTHARARRSRNLPHGNQELAT